MAYFTKRYHPPGTPPGALIPDAMPPDVPLRLKLVEFGSDTWLERDELPLSEGRAYLQSPTVTWIHAQGRPTPEALERVGEAFGLHRLALEDVLNSGQRPKIEAYDGQLFVIMSLPRWNDDTLVIEQVSLFLGANFIISFHDGQTDPFEPVRQRLRNSVNTLRNQSADHLLYALMDVIVDEGFPVLHELGEWIETVEEGLLDRPDPEAVSEIHQLRRELVHVRRLLWPHREILNTLLRDGHQNIGADTRLYFRDCYDHTVQIMELLETYRDSAGDMMEMYLSGVSNRLNETMRVLTVIATIFMPPTFLVGLYGMNFEHMPELQWRYGYALVWVVIIAMMAGMLYFFRRKRWI